MTYREAIDYIMNALPMFQRIGVDAYKADLNNAYRLDEYFGHPHQHFKTIHIAGTNGKGSVSHMLASVLQSAGYRTGLFTSPHMIDFRERIRVNGNMISKKYITEFTEQHQKLFSDIQPSFFEMSVFLAFTYFVQQQVEIAVIETGLGGRLDTTNIITPTISIITNIGLDHTQILGTTIEAIAAEKAGIIKQTIPVIIGENHPQTRPIFEETALRNACPIYFADELCRIDYQLEKPDGSVNSHFAQCPTWNIDFINHDLSGAYQKKNIPIVLTALSVLTQNNIIDIEKSNILQGLKIVTKTTGLQGRWQIIRRNPTVVCDVAHNAHGFSEIVRQLNNTAYKSLFMVLGFVEDKDIEPIVDMLPPDALYLLCMADIPRAMKVEKLSEHFSSRNRSFLSYSNVSDAFEAAYKLATPYDFIYVGGSTFIVSDFLKWKKEKNFF